MAWQLDIEQAQRLRVVAHRRDLQRLGTALASAMPAVQARLAARYDEFIDLGVRRGQAHGLSHLACLGRYIACWAALGGDFEARYPWAGAVLGASTSEGAKAFQLCVRAADQLSQSPQADQRAAVEFEQSLERLDAQLLDAGALGSLLPRERIRLGSPCDLDAVEVGLVDGSEPQYYSAKDGAWSRVPTGAIRVAVRLSAAPDPTARPETAALAPALPPALSVLCSGGGGDATRLRVRTRAGHCCDAQVHPLVALQGPTGSSEWRGTQARELTLALQAEVPDAADGSTLWPTMALESAPSYSLLRLSTCGLRASGSPIGKLSSQIAVYSGQQHLLTWQRKPGLAMSWPTPHSEAGTAPRARCRLERDGVALEPSRWQAGLEDLDQKLSVGLGRLFRDWERTSGVSTPRMHAEPAVMCGDAGLTWGWAQGPQGMQAAAYFRIAGLMELIVCQLNLQLGGEWDLQGATCRLSLQCHGREMLQSAWERGIADAELLPVLTPTSTSFRHPFVLQLEVLATAGATMLDCGPVTGAVVGSCGLRPRADGMGFQWFAKISIEPVQAKVHWHDPLLGLADLNRPLLPALDLLDWTLG